MLDQLAQAGCGIEHSPRNQDRVSQRQDPRRGVRLRGAYVVVVQCVALKKKKVLGVSSTGKRILMTSAMMTMVRENAVPLCAWPNAGANLLLFLSPVRFPRCLPPTPPAHSAPAARPVTSAMTPRPSHHPPPRSRHVDDLRARLAVREASPSPDAAPPRIIGRRPRFPAVWRTADQLLQNRAHLLGARTASCNASEFTAAARRAAGGVNNGAPLLKFSAATGTVAREPDTVRFS